MRSDCAPQRARWVRQTHELFSAQRAIVVVPKRGEPRGDGCAIARSLRELQAFRIVFERHFESIHRLVQRRVGRDFADEFAAETFARAFDHRARYDLRQADAQPWLLGIASNIVRRHRRHERRRLVAYSRAGGHPFGAAPASVGLSADVAIALDALATDEREAFCCSPGVGSRTSRSRSPSTSR
jgi:sigma-70-like protein